MSGTAMACSVVSNVWQATARAALQPGAAAAKQGMRTALTPPPALSDCEQHQRCEAAASCMGRVQHARQISTLSTALAGKATTTCNCYMCCRLVLHTFSWWACSTSRGKSNHSEGHSAQQEKLLLQGCSLQTYTSCFIRSLLQRQVMVPSDMTVQPF